MSSTKSGQTPVAGVHLGEHVPPVGSEKRTGVGAHLALHRIDDDIDTASLREPARSRNEVSSRVVDARSAESLVELPATVEMTVVETEPGLKGATVSNVTKPAKMETGLMVQVPPFITEGEKIRVNTAEGTYLERA